MTSLSYLQSVKEATTSATAAQVSPCNRIMLACHSPSPRNSSDPPPILLTEAEITGKRICDTCPQMTMLYKLEQITIEITECRDKLVRYFLEIITISIMMSTLTLISCGYAIFHKIWLSGFSVVLFITSISALGHICETGDNFTKTIGKAAGILTVLSSQSLDRDIKEQVYRLLMAIGPLKEMEMCGWYKLDFRTFVSVSILSLFSSQVSKIQI
ncbi:uncharacterized protein [Palaemon carinicauda]|uniref:uncharacterized protein n=1 Tax=Palaemon carinicauda TaxID=392227 RepID=UPI0035B69F14